MNDLMHDTMLIPKCLCRATVTLFNDKRIQGYFFLSNASSHHDGPETLPELLNDSSRSFVPFSIAKDTLLLSRPAIRTIEFESSALINEFSRPNHEFVFPLEVMFRTESHETTLNGSCCTMDLRPGHRRPIDLLNESDMFLLVFSDGVLTLINKNAISHVDLHEASL